MSVLDAVRDSGPGDILSFSRTSVPVLESDISGAIILSLIFDDALDTMTPQFSLDNGATTLAPFGSEAWAFPGGGFSLSGSSTVPEPGTALLLGLGLAALGLRRTRPQWGSTIADRTRAVSLVWRRAACLYE